MPIVVRGGPCLDAPPPALPAIDVPACVSAPCPPLGAEVEAALEGYIRRVTAWAEAAWTTCGRAE